MIDTLYIEHEVAEHPRTLAIRRRFPRAAVVPCERYGEVFNRRAQSFRLQKRRPALILAHKAGRRVLEAPPGYGLGARRNHYFSHMLNCLYDCRYCFLQGMYRSAHYVLFVNFEDFAEEIRERAGEAAAAGEAAHFFSGYDCDSLAFEAVTGFAEAFVPLFEDLPGALLELRTKSVQIRTLLGREPLPNCVVAYSFTPADIAEALEHQAPSVPRRIEALERLSQHGWPVGLRFDPVIYHPDHRRQYRELLEQILRRLPPERLHSVSLGPFRLPEGFFRRLSHEYPDEPLLAGPLERRQGLVSYSPDLEAEMLGSVREEILRHVPVERFFPCAV